MNRDIYKSYLDKTYEACSKINTMVTNDNKRCLKDIYVPLKLRRDKARNDGHDLVTVDSMPGTFNKNGQRILIVDRAGMGKSTLTKRLFIDIVENGDKLPLYVELRRITPKESLLLFLEELLALDDGGKISFARDLERGDVVLLLDGFDEVKIEHRAWLRKDIQDFVAHYPQCVFMITSRPEEDFQDFIDFVTYSISPLNLQESYALLKKHDTTEPIAELLIKKLKQRENKGILEYLKTPLLVSLLYAAFNYKHTIPLKKHLFYEQVFDAFFERHDLTKDGGCVHDKLSKLDSYDFERVLRLLGLDCMKSQNVEFQRTELEGIVDRSKRFLPDLNFKSADFVDDLIHSVPLFCKDGALLKWVHKSMQEFFAARFIYMDTKAEQDKVLAAILNSPKLNSYYNMLDIYYDIDNYGFQKNITLPLLEEYAEHYEHMYKELPGISKELVETRIGLLFLTEVTVGVFKDVKRPEQSFGLMGDWCRKHEIKYSNLHAYSIGGLIMCNSLNLSPKLRVLTLLKEKRPELFSPVIMLMMDQVPKGLAERDFWAIKDVDECAESEVLYKCCNSCLTHTAWKEMLYLNYKKTMEEIESIKNNIQAKEDTSLLTSGL